MTFAPSYRIVCPSRGPGAISSAPIVSQGQSYHPSRETSQTVVTITYSQIFFNERRLHHLQRRLRQRSHRGGKDITSSEHLRKVSNSYVCENERQVRQQRHRGQRVKSFHRRGESSPATRRKTSKFVSKGQRESAKKDAAKESAVKRRGTKASVDNNNNNNNNNNVESPIPPVRQIVVNQSTSPPSVGGNQRDRIRNNRRVRR